MGVVEEVGSGVTQVKPGDRVVIPFVIACKCFHCRLAEYAACETTNPGKGAALNQKGILPPGRIVRLQPSVWRRGRRQLYAPKANVGPLRIPEGVPDEQVLFLSDILPTGYQAALNVRSSPARRWPSSVPGRADERSLPPAAAGPSSWWTIFATALTTRVAPTVTPSTSGRSRTRPITS